MEVEAESLSAAPDGLVEPMWLTKFRQWSSLQKSCIAARGPSGIYCSWEGRNCGYTNCPRRIFEEEVIDITKIPKAKVPQKLKKHVQQQAVAIKHLQERYDEQLKVNEQLNIKVLELEKKLVSPSE